MRITDIKVYPTWVGHRNQLIVKVETDEGVHGWGEAGVSGRDPRQPGALWQEMYRSQYFEGGRILTGAISACPAAQRFEFWEAPHLRRRDGSCTNW